MNGMVAFGLLTERQLERSAGPTIAGYLYQFERSILELLELAPGGWARVEGIEDVDLWTEAGRSAIQIKYYAAQNWTPSSMRQPILEMLTSFVGGQRVDYVLYAHFGKGSGPPEGLSVDQLKACLTYSPRGEPVQRLYESFSEDDLTQFAESFSIRTGVSLEEQRKLTTKAIQHVLNCSEEEASVLHRLRAVTFLQEIAVRADESMRVVSREDFIAFLNVREMLYRQWHREYVSFEKFVAGTVRKLRDQGFNASGDYRGVLISPSADEVDDAIQLAVELSRDLVGGNKRRTKASKPWTLVLRGPESTVEAVKRGLIAEKISFNDGYENLGFSTHQFMEPAVVNAKGRGDLLEKASYSIRVISEASFEILLGSGFSLSQLLVLCGQETWHNQLTKNPLTRIDGLDIRETQGILRKVTT